MENFPVGQPGRETEDGLPIECGQEEWTPKKMSFLTFKQFEAVFLSPLLQKHSFAFGAPEQGRDRKKEDGHGHEKKDDSSDLGLIEQHVHLSNCLMRERQGR